MVSSDLGKEEAQRQRISGRAPCARAGVASAADPRRVPPAMKPRRSMIACFSLAPAKREPQAAYLNSRCWKVKSEFQLGSRRSPARLAHPPRAIRRLGLTL